MIRARIELNIRMVRFGLCPLQSPVTSQGRGTPVNLPFHGLRPFRTRAVQAARGGNFRSPSCGWQGPLHHRTAKDCLDPREVPLGIASLFEKVVRTGFEEFGLYVVPTTIIIMSDVVDEMTRVYLGQMVDFAGGDFYVAKPCDTHWLVRVLDTLPKCRHRTNAW